MKHPSTRAVFEYWNKRRGEPAPLPSATFTRLQHPLEDNVTGE
jgi:hypothetical protein